MHSALPRTSFAIALTAALLVASLRGAASSPPATQPTASPPVPRGGWISEFRVAHYLDLATAIQKLPPDARAARLQEIAADKLQNPEVFVLCRMLFDAKENGTFRRPNIGGPVFIDGRGADKDSLAAWPLEPITLYEGIPILVVNGYKGGGGRPESPESYLKYCLENCPWRDIKFAPMEPAAIQKKVEAFLAANPNVADRAEFVRAEAK